ncbi:alkaline ceramidase 3-like isoform X3 [Mizuhopecten yessoensis]|uniref:alkaline ceramidase 3-like isoform X3 n=1 Tax=Mizuhopecten yessoensis TaxID=6573 RepID=UPI000B45BD0B|nr:alkaline ceramidase 3-like isoform X3 [Mizuhopecten yessoensis]
MAPVEGYWGKQTATIDWCEENYRITPYIAEFWNTISNFIFIIPTFAVLAIAVIQNHESRYKWCHVGVTSVGFGSWCFHMTLLYSMQLLDELPMIYSSCFVLYCQLETTSPENHQNRPLQIFFILLSLVITVIYVSTKHVLFFQACYAIMVISMVVITISIIMTLRHSRTLYIASLSTYVAGVIVWLLDQHMCGQLRASCMVALTSRDRNIPVCLLQCTHKIPLFEQKPRNSFLDGLLALPVCSFLSKDQILAHKDVLVKIRRMSS